MKTKENIKTNILIATEKEKDLLRMIRSMDKWTKISISKEKDGDYVIIKQSTMKIVSRLDID